MNLILFAPHEIDRPLSRGDRRAAHVLDVLRRREGEAFDVGLINGPRGKAVIVRVTEEALSLAFTWDDPPPPLPPLSLLIGLPRPQTARDILRDATTLGAGALHFVVTEKSERSYAQSSLWSSDEWRRQLIAGAEQAFDPRIPEVTHGRALADVLATLPAAQTRIALDNYESPARLGECHPLDDTAVVLAFGPERGWSARDRETLRAHRFEFRHLGTRVLRSETAVAAALAIVRAKMGLM